MRPKYIKWIFHSYRSVCAKYTELAHSLPVTDTHTKKYKCLTSASLLLGLLKKGEKQRYTEHWRLVLVFSKWKRKIWMTLLYSQSNISLDTFPLLLQRVLVILHVLLRVCVCACVKQSETLAVWWLKCLKVQQQQQTGAICFIYHCSAHHTLTYSCL